MHSPTLAYRRGSYRQSLWIEASTFPALYEVAGIAVRHLGLYTSTVFSLGRSKPGQLTCQYAGGHESFPKQDRWIGFLGRRE